MLEITGLILGIVSIVFAFDNNRGQTSFFLSKFFCKQI